MNGDGSVNVTSGPFGTGTIFLQNASTVRIRPVGGSYVIYNGITEVASGLTMGSAVAGDTNSLTFAGPIVSAPANSRFISNGYSVDENTTTPVYGASMILGLASSPSTINTPTTTASATSFTAITGPIVINDVIQSPGATTLQSVNYNNQNQDFYSIQINSLNTYNGSTTIGGATIPPWEPSSSDRARMGCRGRLPPGRSAPARSPSAIPPRPRSSSPSTRSDGR